MEYDYVNDQRRVIRVRNEGMLVVIQEADIAFVDGTTGEESVVTTYKVCKRGLMISVMHSQEPFKAMVWPCGETTARGLLEDLEDEVMDLVLNAKEPKPEFIDTTADRLAPQDRKTLTNTGALAKALRDQWV